MQAINGGHRNVIFAAVVATMLTSMPIAARAAGGRMERRVSADSIAPFDTSQVLLTEDGVKNLVTFWHLFLQDPYARMVTLSSVEHFHGTILIRGQVGKYDVEVPNLDLIAAYVPSIATTLASTKLSLAQARELTWSLLTSGLTLRSNLGRYGRNHQHPTPELMTDYVPAPEESATVVWKNVEFLKKHYNTSDGEEARILNNPPDTTNDAAKYFINEQLLWGGYGFREYEPLPATPVFDKYQLVCDTTQPCTLVIDVRSVGGGSISGAKVCVQGTTNCIVTVTPGRRVKVLRNIPPGDVMLDIHADGFVDQRVKVPVLYRYQGSGAEMGVVTLTASNRAIVPDSASRLARERKQRDRM